MFKVSAVPPRRSAMLTVFRGATAINDGTTAEPLRPWWCIYGLCRTSTAVAPRLRCDGGRRSPVMTILRDATAINDGTTAIMAVSLRNHGDNGGATAVYAVQAPQWYRASGVTRVLVSETSNIWEGQFIKVADEETNTHVKIGNIYRPPRDVNENYQQFTEEFTRQLAKFQKSKGEVIIAGDYNIDVLKINNKPKITEYFDCILEHSFFPEDYIPY